MIPYGKQTIKADDVKEVGITLSSDFLTTGPKVEEFEEHFARYVQAKYAVAVSSGTAALHLACLAAQLQAGDELITTPMSFAASANCAFYCQATPVFADITEQGLIDPASLRQKITEKTKIILPVHYTGLVADLSPIQELAHQHHLIVIEDACHALGAWYKNTKIGSCAYSAMTIFSFHPLKHITTGEGGMITTNDQKLYEKLRMLRTHGLTKNPEKLSNKDEGPWHWEMQALGFNYRLTDFQSALGLSQLRYVDSFIQERQHQAQRYREAFAVLTPIELLPDQPYNPYHLFIIKVQDKLVRLQLFKHLQQQDIQCQVHYIPIYWHPYYQQRGYQKGLCPKAEKWYERIISLPLYPSLTKDEQEKVIRAVNSFFASRQ